MWDRGSYYVIAKTSYRLMLCLAGAVGGVVGFLAGLIAGTG